MVRRWLAATLACALVACGISAVGQLGSEPTSDDAGSGSGPQDGSSTVDSGGASDAGDGGDGMVQPVSCDGGAPVVFLPDDGGACPTGTTEEIVQTAPLAGAGACTCGACTPGANPTCNAAGIAVDYGSGSSCSTDTLSFATAKEGCTDFGLGTVTQAPYEKWQARTPTGGTCTATSVPDPTKVTSTSLRRCAATSPEGACLAATPSLKKCIESSAPCGGEYPNAIAFGTAATVECAACGCTRGAAKCVVEHFSDDQCTQKRYQQDLNGVCTRTDDATNVHYFKVRPDGLTCVATPGAATAALTNAKTLCCAP